MNTAHPLSNELFALMAARPGHFTFESGHHGDLWLDVDRLFVNPQKLRPWIKALATALARHNIEAVCGPLTGGAFVAQMVAEELGVDFVYAERRVRADHAGLFPVEYPTPVALHEFVRGRRVAVVNDVINAGSAVRGAFEGLRACGATPIAIGAILVLGDAAANLAAEYGTPLECLTRAESQLWPPSACPLCRSGVPLEAPDTAK